LPLSTGGEGTKTTLLNLMPIGRFLHPPPWPSPARGEGKLLASPLPVVMLSKDLPCSIKKGPTMSDPISRRSFAALAAGFALAPAAESSAADEPAKTGPIEAPFARDYSPPGFKPSWKKPQLNRLL